MSLREGLHTIYSTLLIVTGYMNIQEDVHRTYDEEIHKRMNYLLRKRT